MQDEQGRQSVAEARAKAERLSSLVEGWVNAEGAQRERADRAEARVTALEAATRFNAALIDELTAEVVDLGTRVTALEAALRTALHEWESWAPFDRKDDPEIAECRAVLDGGSARGVEKP